MGGGAHLALVELAYLHYLEQVRVADLLPALDDLHELFDLGG